MAQIPERYIIGGPAGWYAGGYTDIAGAIRHSWRGYLWDAKKFSNLREARRMARELGGKVYAFNICSGETKLISRTAPEGAICDGCRMYNPQTGECRNPESGYYRAAVSFRNVCDEWIGK